MNPLTSFSLLLFVLRICVIANPPSQNDVLLNDFEKINHCAKLATHIYVKGQKNPHSVDSCSLISWFTHPQQLEKILSGTNLSLEDIPKSFKPPIKHFGFAWTDPNDVESLLSQISGQKPSSKKSFWGLFDKGHDAEPEYMFSSQDGRFLVASVSQREFEDASKDISHYANHLQTNEVSHLARIVGMFEVKKLYFAIMVAPFPLVEESPSYAFEFSPATVSDPFTEDKQHGITPYPFHAWSTVTSESAGMLLEDSADSFVVAYVKDLKFLQKHHHFDYQMFLGLPVAESYEGTLWKQIEAKPLFFGNYLEVKFFENKLKMTFCITHFFKKSKVPTKPTQYLEKFDTLRKTKVFYSMDEPRNLFSEKHTKEKQRLE